MTGDLLVLAGFATVALLSLTLAGAICDPGGLYDRMCEWLGLDDVDPAELIVIDPRPPHPGACTACGCEVRA